MATVTTEAAAPRVDEAPRVYDRSSLTGDYLVTILGQTEADYFRCAPEKRFCEYIDGVVYMPSPVSFEHQGLVGFLFHLLDGFQCERGTGLVSMGPAVFRARPGRNLEPDVFVLPADAPAPAPGVLFVEAAVLVVEVLSPSTRAHDLNTKAAVYQAAAVPELWFVDDRDHVLIIHRRMNDGYQIERITRGPCRSAALPGFWIDVAWLWQDPLPNRRRCLEQILAGPPPE